MCGYLGKLPHEFSSCTDEEYEFLKAAWNEMQHREQEAQKKAIKKR